MSLIRSTFIPLAVQLVLASYVISSASELKFLSGVADTKQYFSIDNTVTKANMSKNKRTIKRHHLICLHNGPFNQYNIVYNASPEKCCNDLWLKGLIESEHRQYCLDRMALLPDILSPATSIGSVLEKLNFSRANVRPIHYLTIDEELHGEETMYDLNSDYIQVRHVMARDEHKERENIRDLPDHGVASYSPFHLVDFMPGGREAMKHNQAANNDRSLVSLVYGRVNTTLSSDGGMHRVFRQRVTLSLNGIESTQYIESTKYRMDINTTVLLPLMESVFIDADDPFIVEYDGDSPEPLLCRTSMLDHESLVSESKCSVKFVSSETIDIEQPSFASRQYVVAFQLNASIEFSTNSLSETLEQKLQIGLDYGATLHIRYLSPTSNQTGVFDGLNGIVPIAIHQPTLYSGIVCLTERVSGNEVQYFLLDTDATPDAQRESTTQEPITIHVAVGLDGDYWWVTTITMLCALFGGFIVMRSIDTVSSFD